VSKIANFKQPPLVAVPFHVVKSTIRVAGQGRGRPLAMYTYADGRSCEHPDGEHHSCEYVDARNRLIPKAERLAAMAVLGVEDPNGMKESAAFLREMDLLWNGRAA
jgi:hypothetical protein